MTSNPNPSDIPLKTLLKEFADSEGAVKSALVYRLSDLNPEDIAVIEAGWSGIPVERRRLLMLRLAETSENNFEVDYAGIAVFALQDHDSEVRQHAIAALWYSEDPALMKKFIHMLETDISEEVRAAAAEALGHFVLAGELGDIPESTGKVAEAALLNALKSSDEPLLVHRRSLESLSYSGRDEVPDLIHSAHQHEDLEMRASALFAMGRSADERWQKHILAALTASESPLRYEASRAAGELGLTSAVPRLIQLSQDEDREVQEAAIWALGEIGGDQARAALFRLADRATDDDLLEAIEDAANMAQLSAGQFGAVVLGDGHDDELIEDDVELDEWEDSDEYEED